MSPFIQLEQLFDRNGFAVVFNFLNSFLLSSAFLIFFLTISLSFSILYLSSFNLHIIIDTSAKRRI